MRVTCISFSNVRREPLFISHKNVEEGVLTVLGVGGVWCWRDVREVSPYFERLGDFYNCGECGRKPTPYP